MIRYLSPPRIHRGRHIRGHIVHRESTADFRFVVRGGHFLHVHRGEWNFPLARWKECLCPLMSPRIPDAGLSVYTQKTRCL